MFVSNDIAPTSKKSCRWLQTQVGSSVPTAHQEYEQIDRESKTSIAQGAKGGLALWLDHSLVDRECPVVQSRLNFWTVNAGCTRGLEMRANHREGFMRQTNRRRHTLLVLQVQKLVNKRPHLHAAQDQLGRFSETSSQRAVVLARMMGTADEVAAASLDPPKDVDMTDASMPRLRPASSPCIVIYIALDTHVHYYMARFIQANFGRF